MTHTSRKAKRLLQELGDLIEEIKQLDDGGATFHYFLKYDIRNAECRNSTSPICATCRRLHTET